MENNANGFTETTGTPNNEVYKTNSNPEGTLPYEDPAITNPAELASFPKAAPKADATEIEIESESHLVNRRSPVREGKGIIRTDNNPNTDGFM